MPFIFLCDVHLSGCLLDVEHLPYCFRRVFLAFSLLRIPRASSILFWHGVSWWSIPRWSLEQDSFPSYISSRCQKRDENTVHFVLQATLWLSSRGTQGTSWFSIGTASYFCRVIATILCQRRLTLKSVSLMLAWAWSLCSPFVNATPYKTSFRKSWRNLLHARYSKIYKFLWSCQAKLASFSQLSSVYKCRADCSYW